VIDLHTHSIFSDGSLTPEELIQQAEAEGVSAIALTDHDTTAGLDRLLAAAGNSSVRAIPGVEISAEFAPGTMHILGYFMDYKDPELNRHLDWIRNGRDTRNHEILGLLNDLGCHITWDDVLRHVGDDVVGRPHFAQALIEAGYVEDKQEAFSRYLARGKPAYADRRRLSPEDSILLIRQAGGIPVLAHPSTLNLKTWDLRKLLRRLRNEGLEGIEAYYSEHDPRKIRQYIKLAADYGLLTTGGSDFHGAMVTPDIRIGYGFGQLHVPDELLDKLEARLQH